MSAFNEFFFQTQGGRGYQLGNSLRFRGAQYLTRTNASAPTNQYKATFSVWVKVSGRKVNGDNYILQNSQSGGPPYSNCVLYYETNSGWYQFATLNNSSPSTRSGKNSIRDHAAWYHLVFAFDHTQSTSEDGMKIYVNGIQRNGPAYGGETAGDWSYVQNQPMSFLVNGRAIGMGHSHTGNNSNFDGYMAEFHCIDGQMLDPTSFGEYNDDGVWVPKEVSGLAYGNNGWYLDFSDPNDIGADRSGNGNNFTASGFELTNTTSTSYDWMADSPTNNFATFDPIGKGPGIHPPQDLLNANLELNFKRSGLGDWNATKTIAMPQNSGKFYAEYTCISTPGSINTIGIVKKEYVWATNPMVSYLGNNGAISNHPTNAGSNPIYTGATYSTGDVIGVAVDTETMSVQFYKNGVAQGGTVTPLAYNGETMSFRYAGGADNLNVTFNSGNRPFAHTPPAGFEPLSTAELPAVDITNPSEHFQTVLSDSFPYPPDDLTLGQSYGGGYYVGKILDRGKVYNLIVAPKVSGGLTGQYGGANPTSIAWGYMNQTTNQKDYTYGGTASVALTGGVFGFLRAGNGPNAGTFDITGNSNGTGIGGFNDWYIPAPYELQMAYRVMKPDTTASVSQAIPAAVPPVSGAEYAATTQSTNPLFKAGGSEAWTAGYYKSAAEQSSQDSMVVPFNNGQLQGGHWGRKDNASIYGYARAVRREFAYDAGILDYAQATFPNGLWWIKDRANSNQHQLVDSVRGGNLALTSPTVSNETAYVAPAGNSVAWCWKEGDNFSIQTYTGDGNNFRNHGLSWTPGMVMISNRTTANNFLHWCSGNINNGTCINNTFTEASFAGTDYGYIVNADSTKVNFNSNTANVFNACNANGQSYVMYAWRTVPGYSSFGRYVGNGNADGPFIYTGFRVGWLLVKVVDVVTTNWVFYDGVRKAYNPTDVYLQQTDQQEFSGSLPYDFLSNGFKVRHSSNACNASGKTYIYMAFAEHPFGGSNVSPSPAR